MRIASRVALQQLRGCLGRQGIGRSFSSIARSRRSEPGPARARRSDRRSGCRRTRGPSPLRSRAATTVECQKTVVSAIGRRRLVVSGGQSQAHRGCRPNLLRRRQRSRERGADAGASARRKPRVRDGPARLVRGRRVGRTLEGDERRTVASPPSRSAGGWAGPTRMSDPRRPWSVFVFLLVLDEREGVRGDR